MRRATRSKQQTGFTLLEAMIAIAILSFGILSLAAVYAQGIQVANMTQLDYIAEKKAEEAVETIFAARDSKVLAWTNIRNVTGSGGTSDGIFIVGPQPLLAPGPDGLYGTADDVTTQPDTVILGPGPDKILGTADDIVMPLTNMTRTIVIADVPGESGLRQVTITMNYTAGKTFRQYTLISYIAEFS
ncbi:MAG TPA: prepilin-type N-terminal cleavage/methylation domain-containing protein [Candidatus Acidoferrum sp.]|nr:prepilin-type N-terminal cleavage/methylation domain-containing protein [Candidatus Acidoferrum sp.]